MASFLALYSGESLSDPTLVAVTTDPGIVGDFAKRLLKQPPALGDPVRSSIDRGRRAALRVIHREAAGATCG